MKINKLGLFFIASAVLLSACGGTTDDSKGTTSNETTGSEQVNSDVKTVAFITDTNGVDDRSFNQSAWEGMVEWGNENKVEQGNQGYQYFQSANESDYIPNIDQALNAGFDTIFGIGYKLVSSMEEQAKANPDVNFVMVDEVISDLDNVVSATFKSEEAAYLAGLAAAYTTKTDKVGFIGGVQVAVIEVFDAGFRQGVEDAAKELGKEIEVVSQYAGAFDAPDKGRTIAQAMYAKDIDVIYAAAGATGNGLFQEAKSLNEVQDEKVWVIGVDRDQTEEGNYTKDGKTLNFTLASTLKQVGETVKDLATKADNGEFPGGEHLVYGLEEEGVGLTDGQLTDDVKAKIETARQAIIDGTITVKDTLK
ncbi:BMP family lipoprotein [Enterococcus eurekensis]|uniref:BMP family protein n=1 Tax=Enterococcus eurekensis TaxID=1159753 RepID=A0ABV9M6W2_9ENTE